MSKIAVASAIAVALISTSAFADTVKLTRVSPVTDVTNVGLSVNGSQLPFGGMFNYVVNGKTNLSAFCDGDTQSVLPVGYSSSFTTATPSEVGLSADRTSLLNKLFSSSWNSMLTAGSYAQAGFQAAIWEIIGEKNTTLNLNTGSVYFLSQNTSLAWKNAIMNDAKSYLSSALNYTGPITYTAGFLRNGSYQDMVFAVPEADTYAMFLAGLGLLGFAARRRKA